MGKWIERLNANLAAPPHGGTDETAKSPLLSVMAVGSEGGRAEIASSGSDPDRVCWPHEIGWNSAEIGLFLERRARLLRWGWLESEAEAVAERLVRRDRELDERVTCAECRHHRPGRCGNHMAARLPTTELGRDLAGLLQRCPGFLAAPVRPAEASARPATAADSPGRYPREGSP